jgi:hypothetical protein
MTFLCLNLVKGKRKRKNKDAAPGCVVFTPIIGFFRKKLWHVHEVQKGCFKNFFGDFWGLGNTILTMGLVYLVPICSFSPNQKKKKRNKNTQQKIHQIFRVQCFLGLKNNYNPKKKPCLIQIEKCQVV